MRRVIERIGAFLDERQERSRAFGVWCLEASVLIFVFLLLEDIAFGRHGPLTPPLSIAHGVLTVGLSSFFGVVGLFCTREKNE